MTGVTTGQTSLPTATDSDDVETYGTTSLVAALQTLANLFESTTGHDHSGAGKGKPIVSAGIASGTTLTSPHFTTPVVDSGGLTVTAGGLTVTAGGITVQSSLGAALLVNAAGDVFPGSAAAAAALATTATAGFLFIESCAGVPTGAPTNYGAGRIPLIYDSSNNRIYAYNGAWRQVTLA